MLDNLRIFLFAALCLLPQVASAQPCQYQWAPGAPVAGLAGVGYGYAAVLWDPDGPGPATEVVVIGGSFDVAGDIQANNIATWDPATGEWGRLGDGLNAAVHALAVLPTGELVAGGEFWLSGTRTTWQVARWDGVEWTPLSEESLGTAVYAITTTPAGDLVIGGSLWKHQHIARLEGGAWQTIGGGMDRIVNALTTLPSGELVAGGQFREAGGEPARGVAQWDGESWRPLADGVDGIVHDMALLEGELVVGGDFRIAGGVAVNRVARWHDGQWEPLGEGVQEGTVNTLLPLPGGELLAGGNFSYRVGEDFVGGMLRWDGEAWRGVGRLSGVHDVVPLAGGDLFAVGHVWLSPTGRGVSRFTGEEWTSVPSNGTRSHVLALWSLPFDVMLAGGGFTLLEGEKVKDVARWDGSGWTGLGDGFALDIVAVAASSITTYYAAGGFSSLSAPGNRIVRWTGSSWLPMRLGLTRPGAFALAILPSGDLIAGGNFSGADGKEVNNIARWSGAEWHDMGRGTNQPIRALAVHPGIGLIAGGEFTTMDGAPAQRVAAWSGRNWAPLGEGLNGTVRALLPHPGGDLIAGGDFTATGAGVPASGVARWDGAAWQPLGAIDGSVYALAVMPSGDIIAGGLFETADGSVVNNLARWNGTRWTSMGGTNGRVATMAVSSEGALWIGGYFYVVDGAVSAFLARWACLPPAACYADCDESGQLDFFDFLCFQNRFSAGSIEADCDGSGELDFFDFLCFQSAFAAGCP